MKAIWNGQILAESSDTIVIEGNHYFPKESINLEFFTKSELETSCPWKGLANYYNIIVNDKENEEASWYYANPKPDAIKIVGRDFSDYVAFWRGVQII